MDDSEVGKGNQIVELLRTKYWTNIDESYDKIIELLDTVDLNKMLFQSLEEGYSGFELYRSKFLQCLKYHPKQKLINYANQKLRECKLEGLAFPCINKSNTFCIVVDTSLYYDVVGIYSPMVYKEYKDYKESTENT